jgi:hypothetical protein
MAIEQMQSIHHQEQSLGRKGRFRCGFRPSDHALEPEREPPIGAHMVTPRRGYTHHGIYVAVGSCSTADCPAACVEVRWRTFPCPNLLRDARSGFALRCHIGSTEKKWSVGPAYG